MRSDSIPYAARLAAVPCAVCQGPLATASPLVCGACAAAFHPECRAQLGRCATEGCRATARDLVVPSTRALGTAGPSRRRRLARVAVGLGLALLVTAPVAALARPWLRERTIAANERAAILTLERIVAAESRFREGGTIATHNRGEVPVFGQGGGDLMYGGLPQLAEAKLVERSLLDGADGYDFRIELPVCEGDMGCASYMYWATATPREPGVSGRRTFVVNFGLVGLVDPALAHARIVAREGRPYRIPDSRRWYDGDQEWVAGATAVSWWK